MQQIEQIRGLENSDYSRGLLTAAHRKFDIDVCVFLGIGVRLALDILLSGVGRFHLPEYLSNPNKHARGR